MVLDNLVGACGAGGQRRKGGITSKEKINRKRQKRCKEHQNPHTHTHKKNVQRRRGKKRCKKEEGGRRTKVGLLLGLRSRVLERSLETHGQVTAFELQSRVYRHTSKDTDPGEQTHQYMCECMLACFSWSGNAQKGEIGRKFLSILKR